MTKSKDILSNTTLTVIVMLLSISFVGLSIVNFQLKDMHNNAENRFADVWCQDQTYATERSCHVSGISRGTPVDLIVTLALDGSCAIDFNQMFPKGAGVHPYQIDNLKLNIVENETHHYSTGIYRANESKIECLGEPTMSVCAIDIEGNCAATWSGAQLKKYQTYQKSQKFEVPM